MFQSFVVTMREGIEAFLVVAISLSYLRKTGRDTLIPPVYWGVGTSVLTSALAGYLFSFAANQSLWEGALALFAALLVATLVLQMWRAGRTLKNRIQSRLDSVASNKMSWWGVFLFVVLMITREGMEAALLLGTLAFQMRATRVFAGAVLGLVTAALVSALCSRYGRWINLRRFLQVTAVFLLIFAAQMVLFGVHELAESGVLPHSTQIHDATEPYGPDGIYGHWLTYGLLIVPLVFLTGSYLAQKLRIAATAGVADRLMAK